MALPGIYRVQSVAEIPIVRRNKYQAQNREKTWEFRDESGAALCLLWEVSSLD